MKVLKTLVSWVEIPVTNMERAIKFYEAILNVKLSANRFDDLNMAFFPVEGNGIGGALCKHPGEYIPSSNGVLIYLKADPDIEVMLRIVENNNGKIIQGKKQISDNPEFGYMAVIDDTEGNRVALYEVPGSVADKH